MKKEQRQEYYLFSPFLRIFHWLMAASIVVLFITGFLITKPPVILGSEPTNSALLMNLVRNIHFIQRLLSARASSGVCTASSSTAATGCFRISGSRSTTAI